MDSGRWTNPSQPQTLQIAVFLLYFTAFFGALDLLRVGIISAITAVPWGTLLALSIPGAVLAGRGIASERKWGYQLGVAMAVFPFVFRVLYSRDVNGLLRTDLINLMFEIALVALLLHTQSREYQRIWFK
ncbi:MAG TPA: hypothetical protein VFA94_07820 [Acidimicrobiales bacterium]|nr:hypothetical protein [Acidimicrobiales bacterium]